MLINDGGSMLISEEASKHVDPDPIAPTDDTN
jgi:hypothetical protein